MLRIGLLTSGGDCQALNATMRGIVKTLMTNSEEPIEIYGFEDGYQGLIYSRFRVMTPADFSGILTRGGTILGTSRTPFKRLDIPEADGRTGGHQNEGPAAGPMGACDRARTHEISCRCHPPVWTGAAKCGRF